MPGTRPGGREASIVGDEALFAPKSILILCWALIGALDCRAMRLGKFFRRLLPGLLALVALLVLAPAAMAADGVGVYGRTDDKVVTFFAFGLIAFFAILVTVLSLIQIRLENRKQRRTEDLERLGSR
jgi:putative copper export protein